MSDRSNLTTELTEMSYGTYPELFSKFRELSEEYGGLPIANLLNAFGSVSGFMDMGPYAQNRRVKAISTLPGNYTKDQVAQMVTAPNANELPLRQIEHALEYSAYPLLHTRATYQNLLTYHSYTAPYLVDAEDTKKTAFFREWKLVEKLRTEIGIASKTHEIVGQVLQEGKVFYYPRIRVDKSHNKIDYAFMQQLPSDWVKIVGYNNKSKYTLAFDMMYFAEAGTDPSQFGDLFKPYLKGFSESLRARPAGGTQRSSAYIDLEKVNASRRVGDLPDVYYQNGRWYYWVVLPVDKVFTFEADDTSRNAVSPFTGLFIDYIQLAAYEAIQLELVQNPLVAVLTGEIPYFDAKEANAADQYKLSNAGKQMFDALWYRMLSANNTGGIGIYSAPYEHMTLHQLSEAPSATQISSNGYSYTLSKAGLSGIIPTTGDTRSGLAQISLMYESRFPQTVYACVERMFNCLIENLGLKYDFRFHMFGDIATDEKELNECRQGMTLGILPMTLRYLAIKDMSIFEDIAVSSAIINSGLLDMRVPLVTSYTAKQGESGLPPDPDNKGGRPTSEGMPGSDGQEQDDDSYGSL